MSDDDVLHGREVTGRVKWFDGSKGYGFVVADDVPRDILLHANVLRNFGQNSVADSSLLRIRVIETERGIQAQEVIEITPPDPIDLPSASDRAPPLEDSLTGGPLEPARVKWFDRSKGFGFANVFGDNADVFIHIDVLRRSSLADLEPGEAIAISVAEGARGKLATQVSVWESAIVSLADEWQGSEAAE
jgi:cold shock protein